MANTGPTDEERRLKQEADYSWLSWFNPLSYSFGGLLMMAIVGFGVYFLGFNDKGKKMLGDLFNGLSPEWQDTLLGWGESLGLVPEGSKDLADVARSQGVALGDALSAGTEIFLKPELLYAAMLEKPDAVLKLAKSDKKDEATTAKAMAAVRSIVSDPQKLATLLDAKNKANTYALLEARSPVPFKAGALGTFIDKVGLKDGKPTDELRDLLLAMLDEKADKTTRSAALLKFAQRDPAALATLLEGTDEAAITDPDLKKQVDTVKSQPKESLGAGMQIEANLNARGTSIGAVMTLVQTPSTLVKTMLNGSERDTIFEGNVDLIGNAMGGYEKQQAAELAKLTDPAARNAAEAQLSFYRFLNTGQKDAQGVNHAVNVAAIRDLFKAIESSPANKADPKRTEDVLVGMFGMLTGNEKDAKRLTADNVSTFFADEANARAFGTFFKTIKTGRLPSDKGKDLRGFVNALKNNWGDRTHGLNDVFDDRASVAKVLELVQNPPSAWPSFPGDWGLPEMINGAGTWFFWNVSGATKDMAENRGSIESISTALRNAGVNTDSASKPAKRAPAQTPTLQ